MKRYEIHNSFLVPPKSKISWEMTEDSADPVTSAHSAVLQKSVFDSANKIVIRGYEEKINILCRIVTYYFIRVLLTIIFIR